MDPPPEFNPQFYAAQLHKRSSSGNDPAQNTESFPDSVQSKLTKMVWDTSQQQVRHAFDMYANIDFFRPYFDVDAKHVRNHLILSLIPKKPSLLQKRRSDLYGPLMVLLTLVALLLYTMKNSRYHTRDRTLIGAAFFTCFGYWLFGSAAIYTLCYMFISAVSLIETLSVMGYALFGHCVALVLTLFFCPVMDFNYLFIGILMIFGGLSGLRLAIFFVSRTSTRSHKLIIGSLIVFLHVTFFLYIRFSYRNMVNLNVGGRKFSTTVSTLTRDPDSMLACMLDDRWRRKPSVIASRDRSEEHADSESQVTSDAETEYFIDRDGEHFRYVLNFLRDGVSMSLPSDNTSLLQELLRENDFYRIHGFSELIKNKLVAPSKPLKVGEVIKWRPEAAEYYWRSWALCLATEDIQYAFLIYKTGRKYNDKQTMAMCFGCSERFSIDQITVFDFKVRFEEWEALKHHMLFIRGVVVSVIGDTCCVVEWANHKTLHVPMTALAPASD